MWPIGLKLCLTAKLKSLNRCKKQTPKDFLWKFKAWEVCLNSKTVKSTNFLHKATTFDNLTLRKKLLFSNKFLSSKKSCTKESANLSFNFTTWKSALSTYTRLTQSKWMKISRKSTSILKKTSDSSRIWLRQKTWKYRRWMNVLRRESFNFKGWLKVKTRQ